MKPSTFHHRRTGRKPLLRRLARSCREADIGDTPTGVLDVREFRAACHAVARQTAGSLVEFRLARCVTPSFHQSVIAYRDKTVAVVCDRNEPLVAIAAPRVVESVGALDANPLTFLDVPELISALATIPGLRVLTKADLDTTFQQTDWPHILARDINTGAQSPWAKPSSTTGADTPLPEGGPGIPPGTKTKKMAKRS